jgi:steroid delta-isomerase-like uncharacterized protein
MDPEQIVESLVETVERADADALARLYAEDAVQHHPMAPGPVVGREAIRESEAALFATFSDVTVQRRGLWRTGSTVIAEVVLSATNTGQLDVGGPEALPATGRRVDIPCIWILEVGPDGLITEERDYFDTASIFRQLGLST